MKDVWFISCGFWIGLVLPVTVQFESESESESESVSELSDTGMSLSKDEEIRNKISNRGQDEDSTSVLSWLVPLG